HLAGTVPVGPKPAGYLGAGGQDQASGQGCHYLSFHKLQFTKVVPGKRAAAGWSGLERAKHPSERKK
ncbi:MAG: hypothetical protein ACXWMK_03495, partial [Syntrophales bacterium]